MITKRRLNKLVDDLAIICVMMEEVNNLDGFNMELWPYPINPTEFKEVTLECLIGYFNMVTDYIFNYAIKNEIYEVCGHIEKVKASLNTEK